MHLPRQLIWVQTSFLGDLVLTTGAIALAKRRWPNVRQLLVTTPVGASLLNGHPYLDGVVSMQKRGLGIANMLSTRRRVREWTGPNAKDSYILVPHRSPRTALLSASLGHPSIGYCENALAAFLTHRVSRVSVLHEAVRIALLLEPLGVPREDILAVRPWLPDFGSGADQRWRALVGDFDSSQTLIGIAPGSVWGTKRWPPESFRVLIQSLQEEYPSFGLVLLGSSSEVETAEKVLDAHLPSDRFVNLVGKTSFADMRLVMRKLSLLVTNDSAPMHFASAFNVPTVGLFGATNSAMGFGPLADRSRVCEIDLNCRPCSDHGPQVCPLGHFRCMRDLSVVQVMDAIRSILPATAGQ